LQDLTEAHQNLETLRKNLYHQYGLTNLAALDVDDQAAITTRNALPKILLVTIVEKLDILNTCAGVELRGYILLRVVEGFDIFVVKGLTKPLLGRPAIDALQ